MRADPRGTWLVLLLAVLLVFAGAAGCSEGNGQDLPDGETDADAENGDDVMADGDEGGADDGTVTDKGPDDDGDPCGPDGQCVEGAFCCKGWCSNLDYDPLNCGKCGNVCKPNAPFCSGGECGNPMCIVNCEDDETCCGGKCCTADEVCCIVIEAGSDNKRDCYRGHCPAGCPTCK